MLGSQQRFSSSMSSLANVGGGPYPTAQAGPLNLSTDPSHMPILRSHSPKPPSPGYHGGPPQGHRGPSNPHHSYHGPPPHHHGHTPPHGQKPRNPSPPNSVNSRAPPHRPIPNPATGYPSFTSGRKFTSEAQLQHIINWQTVTSRNLFDDPPTFQSLLIFLLSSVPSPAVNNFVKQILNTPDHIEHLQKCWAILKRNDREELMSFGMPERVGDMRFEIYILWLKVRLAWRIVQALKNAKGDSRIAEIGEWAMFIIDMNRMVSPEKFDPVPLLTFACSLTYPHPSMSINSKVKDTTTPLQRADRDKMAVEYFEMGFPLEENPNFLPSTVYAKAHYSRLLRKLELISDAEIIEQSIRDWWTRNGRLNMPKARFVDLVCFDGDTPANNVILKNISGFFERKSENGSASGPEEADSGSGRDSGIDVGPVSETQPTTKQEFPPRTVSQRRIPDVVAPQMAPQVTPQKHSKPMSQTIPPPQQQQQTPPKPSATALPPLKPYSSQLQTSSLTTSSLPPLKPYAPQSASLPPMKPYTPQMDSTPPPPPPASAKPYSPQIPSNSYVPTYDYTGSSDSLESSPGKNEKSKARSGFGAKINFLRKDRVAV